MDCNSLTKRPWVYKSFLKYIKKLFKRKAGSGELFLTLECQLATKGNGARTSPLCDHESSNLLNLELSKDAETSGETISGETGYLHILKPSYHKLLTTEEIICYLTAEKLGQNNLNQVTKADITSNKLNQHHVLLGCNEKNTMQFL